MNCRIAKRSHIFLFSLFLFSLSYAEVQFETVQADTQNGYFLSETFEQTWDGADWVDDWKYTYSYDANYNCTEELLNPLRLVRNKKHRL